jgi:putative oxidoreductase
MAVAFFVAHAKDEFMVKELPFLFLLLSIVIFITGSGRYSIDGMMQNRNGVSGPRTN